MQELVLLLFCTSLDDYGAGTFDSSSELLCSRFVMVDWDRLLSFFSLNGLMFSVEAYGDLSHGQRL